LKELRHAHLRADFGSYLQEALLADHFLTRGHSVAKGKAAGNGRNPDLDVVTADFTVTVEVYSPRSWQWRKDWLDDVVDAFKYADIPYAYSVTIDVVVHGMPMDTELLQDVILDTGEDVLTRITSDLMKLDDSAASTTRTYDHRGGELTTRSNSPAWRRLARASGVGSRCRRRSRSFGRTRNSQTCSERSGRKPRSGRPSGGRASCAG
jgi:hypothetical protein